MSEFHQSTNAEIIDQMAKLLSMVNTAEDQRLADQTSIYGKVASTLTSMISVDAGVHLVIADRIVLEMCRNDGDYPAAREYVIDRLSETREIVFGKFGSLNFADIAYEMDSIIRTDSMTDTDVLAEAVAGILARARLTDADLGDTQYSGTGCCLPWWEDDPDVKGVLVPSLTAILMDFTNAELRAIAAAFQRKTAYA